jgi:hypothetical protein
MLDVVTEVSILPGHDLCDIAPAENVPHATAFIPVSVLLMKELQSSVQIEMVTWFLLVMLYPMDDLQQRFMKCAPM